MLKKVLSIALRSILLASILGLSQFSHPHAESGSIQFETLGVEDGLSQSTVRAIYQDKQGYMWFGTDDGLNKYDGYQFTVYKHDADDPTSLIDNTIYSIFEDSTGALWIGTPNGLDCFDRQNKRFIHYRHDENNTQSIGGSIISSIAEDRTGTLWVGVADGGLNRLDRATGTFTRFTHDRNGKNSIADNAVYDLYTDEQSNLWIATDSGLDRLNLKTLAFFHYRSTQYNPNTLSDDRVRFIVPGDAGKLWVGTENGLNRMNPQTRTVVRFLADPEKSNRLYSNIVSSLLLDSQGNLWIGGRNGVDTYDPDLSRFIHYAHNPNDPHSLSNDAICSLYEDRSGTIWVGTYGGGISRYNRTSKKFSLYQHIPNEPNSLNDSIVYSIYEDQEGVVWIGTMDGGLNRLDPRLGKWSAFLHDPDDPTSLSANEVRAIVTDLSGNLWVGTTGGGLNRLNRKTGNFSHYLWKQGDPTSLTDNDIRVLFVDRTGALWIGTHNGGLDRLNPDNLTFTHFSHDPTNPYSLSYNDVRAIYEDRSGNLWIGTTDGLNMFNQADGRFVRYYHDPNDPTSLSNNRIMSIVQDAEGKMWIGTLLGGLDCFDVETGKFTHYTEKNGLPNDSVYGILGDLRGNLWLSTNRGLSRFNPHTGEFRNYDVRDGLQNNEFSAGAYHKGESGEFYFGGIKGFNAFYPTQVRDNPTPPPVVITSFKKFNQVVETEIGPNETIELSYLDNFISFEFAALDYNAPQKNLYAYKLEGFDENWVFSGTRNYATYTNLKGGRYTLRVIASNNDGIWNGSGVAISIVVIPPIWERWWFLTLVGIGAGAFLWGSYQYRLKRIQMQTWILEKQVHERTQEIERRREVAEGLREIIGLLNSDSTLDETLALIITQVIRLMGPQTALIFRKIPGRGPKITAGTPPHLHEEQEKTQNNLPDWVTAPILAGETVNIPDIQQHLSRLHVPSIQPDLRLGAILGVPLVLNDEIDGGLILFYDHRRSFHDDDCATATTIADHAALAIANADLRAQAEEIAINAERSRLARDLHDAVTQTLFATSLISEVLPRIWQKNPDEGKKKLMEIRELTRGALAEMRTLLMELRPTALMDVPLSDLLVQLSEAFTGQARVPVAFTTDERCALPAEVQTGFYRIAQEALNNIAKHARASQVEMALTHTPDQVRLWIQDNGRGFSPENISSDHLGLQIMAERAQAMNAKYDLQTEPGQGTRIEVIWERNGTSKTG